MLFTLLSFISLFKMKTPLQKWTIKGVLSWTTKYFSQKGIDSPRLTAEYLLSHALNLKRVELYINYDKPLTPEELKKFKLLIKRRLRHEPLAYIIGEHAFWSLNLEINPAVLIPRPETELVVEIAIDIVRKNCLQNPVILDWGTGSGAIALALKKELSQARVMATDISFAALQIAQRNMVKNKLSIGLVQGKGLNLFKKGVFDMVVSNPPYIKSEDIPHLAPEVRNYEPQIALDGGKDGLKFVRYLLKEAGVYLKKRGWVIMEIGHNQAKTVQEITQKIESWGSCNFVKDHSGIKRVVVVEK